LTLKETLTVALKTMTY